MNKKGFAMESILSILVIFFIIFTIIIVIMIQITSRESSKKIIKEEFLNSDSNHMLLSYLKSNYQDGSVLDFVSNMDENMIQDSSKSFFNSLDNYWALEINYNGKKFFFDKPGDYSYERFAMGSKNPSASIILPDKDDNKITLGFYRIDKGENYYG
ncbi:MAG TPA: hypothetical protein VJB94_03040 [Candidatus Nanoarchaeia archaeon]|nr:hypothetical protein [Candidatus Nanoarchaeia archaeon]